jgi:hypothetical protein
VRVAKDDVVGGEVDISFHTFALSPADYILHLNKLVEPWSGSWSRLTFGTRIRSIITGSSGGD